MPEQALEAGDVAFAYDEWDRELNDYRVGWSRVIEKKVKQGDRNFVELARVAISRRDLVDPASVSIDEAGEPDAHQSRDRRRRLRSERACRFRHRPPSRRAAIGKHLHETAAKTARRRRFAAARSIVFDRADDHAQSAAAVHISRPADHRDRERRTRADERSARGGRRRLLDQRVHERGPAECEILRRQRF